jgi:hypothetical protein
MRPTLHAPDVRIYARAVEFLRMSARIGASFPHPVATLEGELERSALAIAGSVVDALGSADPRPHLDSARSAAIQCASVIGLCLSMGVGDADELREAQALLVDLVRELG